MHQVIATICELLTPSAFSPTEESRKLFEKEEDNNYEEEAAVIQLKSVHLYKMLKRSMQRLIINVTNF